MDTWLSRAIEQEAPTSKSMIKWWEHVTLMEEKNEKECIEFIVMWCNRL